ncbi:MAG: sigma 54-interacting transcriptional regulator [Deferribacteres bacterium]|nr:sigma 54-interacting transcriptional regulator [candidate division KSB1 bacterium]MCB9503539.1 sigma 54-interacting transcriptional regulator [Deferribacteres bacterium]
MESFKQKTAQADHSRFREYVSKFNELKTVFDSLPDGIVAILDKEMKIATANRAISEMLEMPLDEIIGHDSTDLLEERFPGVQKVVRQTLESKRGVRNYTIERFASNGDLNSFLVSTAVADELEDEFGIVLILHDISEITRLRKLTLQLQRYGEIIGKSKNMKKLYALIESIKHYDTSVLIVGETGTGKELFARALHDISDRKNKPFVPVNCSALPSDLIESELFGYTKGAFTGAATTHIGRFQVADGGTLFLDEVGTLPLKTQVKLLRAIQERVIEPLGSSKSIAVDVRIVSATNRDLVELISKDEFRDDLYYRLKVLQINLPPLRERVEDIAILADHFITRLNRYYNRNIVGLAPTTRELLEHYLWPGNVRELQNAIEHAFVLTTGALLEPQHLPPEIRLANQYGAPPAPPEDISKGEEEEDLRRTLLATNGNLVEASKILDIHRTTLWRKMKEYRIEKGFGKQQ